MGSRLCVLPACQLTTSQLAALSARLDAPEHRHDRGGCLFWGREAALAKLFVAMLPDSGRPIGLVHVDGPPGHVHAAWWLDSAFRGQGLGGAMVEALAAVLKAGGCTGVGRIAVDTYEGRYDQASASLVRRFNAQFAPR